MRKQYENQLNVKTLWRITLISKLCKLSIWLTHMSFYYWNNATSKFMVQSHISGQFPKVINDIEKFWHQKEWCTIVLALMLSLPHRCCCYHFQLLGFHFTWNLLGVKHISPYRNARKSVFPYSLNMIPHFHFQTSKNKE